MAKHRSVILGCGPRSHDHVRPYGQVEDAEMVACCDAVDDLRKAFCKRYGLRGYADAVEMIEAEKPDLIHLVTRPATRVEQLTMVSDLGVPACIVEKPIATEVRDWRALCDLAAKTATKIGVGAQWRYSPILGKGREALASGRLGRRLFMESTAGSTICDQGVHVLDWITSLNDESPAVQVFGAASGASELDTKHPSPDDTTAQLLFENGVHCLWTLGRTAPRVEHAYAAIQRYSHCRVAVYCERGRVLFEEFGKWEIAGPDGVESGENHSMDEWMANNDAAQAGLTRSMLR
jgi:predicted dehydrogenase